MDPVNKNSPEQIQNLIARINQVLKWTGFTQRAFAERIGISPSFLNNIVRSGAKPSIETVLGIAQAFPQVNLRWLLTGAEAMLDAPGKSQATSAQDDGAHQPPLLRSAAVAAPNRVTADSLPPNATLDDYKTALEQELVKLWGVGDLALMARRGDRATARAVLRALLAHYPAYIGMEALAQSVSRLGIEPIELVSGLKLLQKQGLIERVGDEYRIVSAEVELNYEGAADLSQLAILAMSELITSILPKAISPQEHGKLVVADFYVPPGTGPKAAKALLTMIRSQSEAWPDHPQGEHITLVVGLGVDEAG